MTIAAAYLVSDGVVLGADSTTTVLTPEGGVSQLMNHTQKVFEVGEHSRFGLCTWGAGAVGALAHRTVSAMLGDQIDATDTVVTVAKKLERIVGAEMGKNAPSPGWSLGYCVGGVSSERSAGCVRMTWDDKMSLDLHPLSPGDAQFDGMPDCFSRVFHGFAPGIFGTMIRTVRARIPDLKPEFDQVLAEAFDEARRQFVQQGFRDIPIREHEASGKPRRD